MAYLTSKKFIVQCDICGRDYVVETQSEDTPLPENWHHVVWTHNGQTRTTDVCDECFEKVCDNDFIKRLHY